MNRASRRAAEAFNRKRTKKTIYIGPPPGKSAAWAMERSVLGARPNPIVELDTPTSLRLLGGRTHVKPSDN